MVECERLVLSENDLGLTRGHKCTDVTSLYLLPCQLGTDPEGKGEKDNERKRKYKSSLMHVEVCSSLLEMLKHHKDGDNCFDFRMAKINHLISRSLCDNEEVSGTQPNSLTHHQLNCIFY